MVADTVMLPSVFTLRNAVGVEFKVTVAKVTATPSKVSFAKTLAIATPPIVLMAVPKSGVAVISNGTTVVSVVFVIIGGLKSKYISAVAAILSPIAMLAFGFNRYEIQP